MPGNDLARCGQALAIVRLVCVAHIPIQVLRRSPLDLLDQVQGLDDLNFGSFTALFWCWRVLL
jgi:hypothetical protein